jgi:SHAQKYF class myb-like DNA-binding protein
MENCVKVNGSNGGALRKTRKRQVESDDINIAGNDETSPMKKRLIWTPELQKKFEVAVKELGDKAIPKLILEFMKDEGITRQQVASHLQKWRLKQQDNNCQKLKKSKLTELTGICQKFSKRNFMSGESPSIPTLRLSAKTEETKLNLYQTPPQRIRLPSLHELDQQLIGLKGEHICSSIPPFQAGPCLLPDCPLSSSFFTACSSAPHFCFSYSHQLPANKRLPLNLPILKPSFFLESMDTTQFPSTTQNNL